uniref:Uncharacterized protein n=1 Tax=Anguilla anguilla TaxID=7936 RepID=A0A0E9Q069_ANGAN
MSPLQFHNNRQCCKWGKKELVREIV